MARSSDATSLFFCGPLSSLLTAARDAATPHAVPSTPQPSFSYHENGTPPQQQYTPQGTTAEANEAYTPFGGARPSRSSSDEAEGEEEVFVDAEEPQEDRGEFFVLS